MSVDTLAFTYALVSATAAICLLPFVAALRARRGDLFEPVYWASAYFFLLFVLRPLYDLTLGSEFLGKLPFDRATSEAFNRGMLYAFFSFCLFLVAYYSNLGARLANRLPSLPLTWNGRAVSFAWPLLLGLGFVFYFTLVHSFGGWNYYVCNKQETLTAPGQGYLLLGVSLISIAFTLKLTQSLESGGRAYLAYGLLLPILLVIGFFSGSKGTFLIPLFVAIVATFYLRGNVRFRHIMSLMLFVFLMFPIFNTYRHHSCSEQMLPKVQILPKVQVSSNAQGTLDAQLMPEVLIRHAMSRFYGIDSLTIIIRDTPESMAFQHGKTIFPLLVAWIPRQLWEDKPTISFGKVFAEEYLGQFFGGTGVSASPTLLGEAYLNWHLPGMLLVALLSGVVIRTAYIWLTKRNFGAPAVFVYAQFFIFFFAFWEASIAGLLAERIATLIILLTLVFLIGKRAQSANIPA